MARQLRQEVEVDDLDLDTIETTTALETQEVDNEIELGGDVVVIDAPIERRPMDEAPRDGTVVVGYHPESYPEGQQVRWKAARQYHIVERRWADGGKWVDATYLAVLWQQPIEWIPLPKEDVA